MSSRPTAVAFATELQILFALALLFPAVDALAQSPDPKFWTPNGFVYAMAVQGGTLYLGGAFTSLSHPDGGGTVARNRLAALDLATGAPTAWNPNANGNVYALTILSSTIYVGGDFSTVGGQGRICLGALNNATGAATAWNPGANGTVYALTTDGLSIFAGGFYTQAGGAPRANLAALDPATGAAVTAWNPGATSYVEALVVGNGILYTGGSFVSLGGQPRDGLGAVNASTGTVTAWNPGAAGGYWQVGGNSMFFGPRVRALAVDGPTVYAGGSFTAAGGAPRVNLVALDGTNGVATAWNAGSTWNPTANYVTALAKQGSIIYVGGSFTSLGEAPRFNLAALDATTAAALPWVPDPSQQTMSIRLESGVVCAGGLFGFAAFIDAATVDVPDDRAVPDGPLRVTSAPQPIRTVGTLRFTLPSATRVSLSLFDPSGRRVRQWLDRVFLEAGPRGVELDARGLAAGLYLVRLEAGDQRAVGKLVVVP
jgi:hypothetical protein